MPSPSSMLMHLALSSALLLFTPQNPAEPPPIATALQQAFAAPRQSQMKWGALADVRTPLATAYASQGWQPLWLGVTGASSAAQRVIAQLQRANDLGLDPGDYDAGTLARLVSSVGRASPADQAAFELTLSTAVVRFGLAIHRGRVDPRIWHPLLRMPASAFDTAGTLIALSRSGNQDSIWRALQPQHTGYWRLMTFLQQMRSIAPEQVALSTRDFPPRLEAMAPFAAAPRLRALMVAMGELDAHTPPAVDTLYSMDLVDAVKRFQAHQALAPDGIIGPATLLRLVVPWSSRIRQVELTLERWRWLPIPPGTAVVTTNIPAMRVRAVDPRRGGADTLIEMNAVIGKVMGFQTPLLSTVVSGVQVRPPWVVPTSIARDEIKPKALRDSTIMTRERFVLLRGDSILPPTMANIRRIAAGVELRQLPGPLSALSQLKLAMANPANIYLHDSPERTLFGKPERTFSHGCIRLADAKALAGYLLTGNTTRADSSWFRALRGDSTIRLPLTHPVPVLIVYHEVEVDASGRPVFYADLYNVDPALDAALQRGYPFKTIGSGPPREH